MSLETVVEDIREEAEAEAAEIRSAAEDEAQKIVAEAERNAQETLDTAEREVEQQIDRDREQRLSSATLEAKQERLGARRDLLEEVYERVAARLADLPDDRKADLTRALIDASEDEFGDAEVAVYGAAADQELLEDVVEEYPSYEVAGEIDAIGGVILESDASRVRVNNTFDALLEEVWEDSLKEISDQLFEQ